VIASVSKPIIPEAGSVVVKGNLAMNGAVIKPSAATPALMKHTGRAVVFESIEDYHARVDDPSLDVDETCVMVLKYVGPVGYPACPKWVTWLCQRRFWRKG
jgi:dihydroxy-acid dehydratase